MATCLFLSAEFLCYYDGSSARLNLLGKCVIPYSEIIEHYKSLWDANAIPAAVNGERNNATNNFGAVYNYSCGIIRTGKFKKECMVSWCYIAVVFSFSFVVVLVFGGVGNLANRVNIITAFSPQ